jgi:hypothetical protein
VPGAGKLAKAGYTAEDPIEVERFLLV